MDPKRPSFTVFAEGERVVFELALAVHPSRSVTPCCYIYQVDKLSTEVVARHMSS